jgi:hypothetical protein
MGTILQHFLLGMNENIYIYDFFVIKILNKFPCIENNFVHFPLLRRKLFVVYHPISKKKLQY